MRQGYSTHSSSAGVSQEDPEPLISVPLGLTDHSGRKRQGHAVLLRGWPTTSSNERPADGEDFRIVILSEPPQQSISPGERVAVSAPTRPLTSAAVSAKEPTAAYSAAKSGLTLPSKDLELLRRGSLFAAAPLQVTAEEIFAGGKARLTLLARDLLASSALAEYLNPIAIALSAPNPAKQASWERLQELKEVISALRDFQFGDEASEAKDALARLSELAFAAGTEEFLACAERLYPGKQALMEEIYVLRAFRDTPREADGLLSMRRFLGQAVVPVDEAEMALDRSLALEQLTFATLAVEPQRLPPLVAMLHSFRRKYISAYRDHHTRYWAEMARLHARLREAQPHAESLRRLNTLSELGPPVGAGTLAAYEELVADTAGCPLIGGVEEMLGTEAVCPACGLSLDQWAPAQRIDEILSRIERACDHQMTRLSSNAVQQVLRRSNDPRLEQFLRMIQASQLSSLRNFVNDELVGYLRRFLVESRIQEALQPIFDQLQEGGPPKGDEAQTAMREVSQVLQRAFQATQKALPPGEATVTESAPPRRKRKR